MPSSWNFPFLLSSAAFFPITESNKFPLCSEENRRLKCLTEQISIEKKEEGRKFYCTFHNITRESCKIYVASSDSLQSCSRLCIKKLFIVGEFLLFLLLNNQASGELSLARSFELCRTWRIASNLSIMA